MAVIPNGIDLNLYEPGKKRPSSYLYVGMQSRLVKIKDHETLIGAVKILNEKKTGIDYKLQIAGEGANKTALEELVNELELNSVVEFVGMLNEVDLIQFLQGLDIYVHATLGETMSTAIMQSMACGKSIIASDVNGVNNMITHNQNGLLVPPKNETAMAEAIFLLA